MKLVIYFGCSCAFSNKGLDVLQLTLVSRLKPRRIVKNELRVAGKAKRAANIMDSTLVSISVRGNLNRHEQNE